MVRSRRSGRALQLRRLVRFLLADAPSGTSLAVALVASPRRLNGRPRLSSRSLAPLRTPRTLRVSEGTDPPEPPPERLPSSPFLQSVESESIRSDIHLATGIPEPLSPYPHDNYSPDDFEFRPDYSPVSSPLPEIIEID